MSLQQKLKEDLKDAMRAKDTVRLNTIRGILTAFTNELVATKRTPQTEMPDDEAVQVLQKLAKQRKDSIEQYHAGGREDLVEGEKAELVFIQEYLPKMMERDEIIKLALAKKESMALDVSKKNMLIGALMKDLKGKADGGDVKAVVDELFK
jgi:hypothetical protein